MLSRTTWRRALALAITTVVACNIPTRPSLHPNDAYRLAVSPKLLTLQQNQAADFTAIGFTSAGDTATLAISWTATSGSIIDTSTNNGRHNGRYRAGADTGKVKVVAHGNPSGPADTAVVTVTQAPVTTVAVSPAAAIVAIGRTVQLYATPQDVGGNPLSGRVVTWASTNPGVAAVNGSGLVSGVAPGAATVTAACEGQSGTVAITVTVMPVASVAVSPAAASVTPGQAVQLTATPKDANGTPLTGRTVTWATSNAAVASVSGNGLVTGGASGTATITASSEGQNGTAAITVTNVPVASVAVTPATASVQVGQTVQLTATPQDASGSPLAGRVVTWASSAPGIATVSASGLVTGVAAGTATLTATSEGKSGTATVTVTFAPVASVTVSPAPASVAAGQTVQLTATPKDANGNPLTGRVVTWATSNGAVATVSAGGLVSGLVVGTATISATSEGQSGSSAITVVAAGLGCAAACRYVAVNGNDANAGTKTAPWRTIQHAADVMNPGDTVIVNDGVYTGGANVVTITRSGTAAAWFVFRAANRWGAIIDGQNNSSTTGFEINGNYVRVEGFEVRNTSRYAMETYGGREDIAGNHDVVLVQNHLHDVGHICTGSTGGIVGVSAYSDNLTIERNVIHDIGRLGPGEQGCVEPNANWQNHDHGIYNGVGNNVVVRNNVFYNFTHGWAIQRYNGAGSVTTGLTIVNNTFGFPNPWRDAQIIIATTTNNIIIANNIFYQPTTAGVWFDGAGDGATLVGNVSTDAVQTLGTGLIMSGNMPNTDPLFVNATGFNFHLTAGSPARGLGAAAWCPSVDFDGVARSGACSAGAFQN